MKVKLLKKAVDDDGVRHFAGSEVDVKKATADAWAEAGVCEKLKKKKDAD